MTPEAETELVDTTKMPVLSSEEIHFLYPSKWLLLTNVTSGKFAMQIKSATVLSVHDSKSEANSAAMCYPNCCTETFSTFPRDPKVRMWLSWFHLTPQAMR
jgi:hypothetical protein